MIREISKEFILSIPKRIDGNNCWVPTELTPTGKGYINIGFDKDQYKLHKIIAYLWHGLDLDDYSLEATHNCNNKACFNPEHIIPGTQSKNQLDSVKAGTHNQARKTHCPQGHPLEGTRIYTKNGIAKMRRYCLVCHQIYKKAKREANKRASG